MSATTLEPGATVERGRGARSGLVGLAGAAVSGVFGFALAVVVARGFGTAGSGAIFAAIGLLTVVAAVCCLGADTGLVWALPRRESSRGGLLTVALLPPMAVAVILAGAGLLLAGPLAETFRIDVRLLDVALVAVPLAVAMTILLSAVRAVRPITSYAAVQFVLLPVGRPILVGAVALASGGVVAAMAGWTLPAVAAVAACVLLLRRPLAGGLRPATGDWRMFWSFALPRAVSAAIDSGSMWVGVLLTAALATQADAGVFGGVGRYVLAGQLAMQGLRVAIAPQLSRLLGAGRTEDAAAVHRQATVWSIVLCWPVYLLLAIFAPAFLALFGGEFVAGAGALAILGVAMLVNVGLGTVQTVLLMSGRSRAHLVATAAGLACTVGLGVWWIPAGGLTGAACAWGAGIVVENVLAAVAARAVVGPAVLSRAALVTAAGVGTAVGAAGAVAVVVAGRGLSGLLLAAAFLGCVVAVAATRPRVRAEVAFLRGRGAGDTARHRDDIAGADRTAAISTGAIRTAVPSGAERTAMPSGAEQTASPAGANQTVKPAGTDQTAEPDRPAIPIDAKQTAKPAMPADAEHAAEPAKPDRVAKSAGARQTAMPAGAEQTAIPAGAERAAMTKEDTP